MNRVLVCARRLDESGSKMSYSSVVPSLGTGEIWLKDLNSSAAAPMTEETRLAALHRFEILDTPPEPALDQITRLASRLLRAPMAVISLVDRDRQWFKSRVGVEAQETSRELAFCHHAIQSDEVMFVGDATRDPRFKSNPLVTGDPKIRFYAGAPLRTLEGLALGTICVIDDQPRETLSPEDIQTLRDLSAMVMAHIEARQQMRDLHPVSGLPNRYRLLRDLDGFIADPLKSGATVVVIDTATPVQFGEISRTLGHGVADAFEIGCAERIAACLPARTKLYHLSPARFACVLAYRQAERLLADLPTKMRAAIVCQDMPITASSGVGLAEYPKDGTDSIQILRAAVTAADEAVGRRVPWCFYEETLDVASQRAFRLLKDLTAALVSRDQFSIVYQPKVDLDTNRCLGSEALLRWTHPEFGPISPAEFIPLAERTFLIQSVTALVLNAVFTQVAVWRAAGMELKTSINISMLDLDDDQFAVGVEALLREHKIKPEWIDFEVTESALMKDQTRVRRQLDQIRRLGIEIAIDDFGAGQSALSYLKNIPASILKIDQLFVRGLMTDRGDQSMVRSTIELAHELGYRVVAEGIETQDARAWLRDRGCDVGQGYQISKPLAPAAFEAWLQAEDRRCAA
jgi:EAL domain-containing protein (putative c-di-GMP-specific phosphodiesterase class I)/GGDEF domain-containing protein